MTYQAIYKCRLCGETYQSGETGNRNIALDVNIHLVYRIPLRDESRQVAVIGDKQLHSCKDGSLGIADFRGFKEVEE